MAKARLYKLKIKRAGEEDFQDLFHLMGETVQDLIDSFKVVYGEEENTHVRVQLKPKDTDAWASAAPTVLLSEYKMEVQIILRSQGNGFQHTFHVMLLPFAYAIGKRKNAPSEVDKQRLFCIVGQISCSFMDRVY